MEFYRSPERAYEDYKYKKATGYEEPGRIAGMEIPKGWDKALDNVSLGLNVAGILPVVGSFADLANAGLSVLRGRPQEAVLNTIFAIPGIGDIPQAARAIGGVGNRIKNGVGGLLP